MYRSPFFFILFLCLLCSRALYGQHVHGHITDALTGEPVRFAHILLKGTFTGEVSDTNGRFVFPAVFKTTDSLRISAVGYLPHTVPAVSRDTLRIRLAPVVKEIGSVEIIAGENPAILLLRKVLQHKPYNNPEYQPYYSYDSYSKIEIDLKNVSKKPPKKGLFKEFAFMWNNIDTTDTNHTRLPVFFSETAADYYYRKEPRSEKEYVKGTRVSGFQNPDVSRMVTDVDNKVNLYGEYLYIFNKNFPSPLNDNFKVTYYYYLDDSFAVDGVMHYLINFLPRNPADPAFTGYMIIHGGDYAVTETRMAYRAQGNVNFIRGFDIDLKYRQTPEGFWFQERQKLVADLTMLEKMEEIPGLIVEKTAIYSNPKFEKPADTKIFRGENKLILNEEALEQKDDFWQARRPDTLTEKESTIYTSVDSLRKNAKFRVLKGIASSLGGGYIRVKKIDIGNVQTFFSWNSVEGPRAKIGARTNRFLSKKFFTEAWLAYGFRDTRLKGGSETFYYPLGLFNRRHHFGLRAVYDIEQVGMSQNAMPLDNVFTSISRTSRTTRLTLAQEGSLYYEHDWFDGFVTRLTAIHRRVMPQGEFHFQEQGSDGAVRNLKEVTSAELMFNMRFAYKDRRLSAGFKRRIFVNKYPILAAEIARGFKGIFGSDYNYWRAKLSISHRQKMGKLGYMDYTVEGGKIWGNIPYNLLEVHTGNQTFINDEAAFNTMRFYEFISDEYVSIHVENHLEGFLLNRIPLLKKLKWREFVVNKLLIGRLSDRNRQGPLILPDGTGGLKQPYWETGFGIENIFKVIRIDFLWRVGPIDNPLARRFHIKPSLYLRF